MFTPSQTPHSASRAKTREVLHDNNKDQNGIVDTTADRHRNRREEGTRPQPEARAQVTAD